MIRAALKDGAALAALVLLIASMTGLADLAAFLIHS